MFHAPTTESQQNDSTCAQSTPERTLELSRPVPSTMGSACAGASAGGHGGQPLAYLHSAYGNQAVLRMLSRAPSSIQTRPTVNQPADSAAAPSIREKAPLRVARYGQTSECKDEEHLKPFIWPGHPAAKDAVANAIGQLGKDPLDPTVKSELESKFGPGASLAPNKQKIIDNFGLIQTALKGDYLYHCANPCEKPNKGERAWTDKTTKDITICFDQVSGYSTEAAAWIIMHENVHRGMNVWAHDWAPTTFYGCVTGGGWHATALILNNPDSYACFASAISKKK